MKIKKEYILITIIIAVSLLYLTLKKDSGMNYELPELASIGDKPVTAILMVRPEGTIELTKDGENWVVSPEGYRTLNGKAHSLIDALSELTIQDLISPREDYELYELDDKTAVRLTLYSQQEILREVLVGKTSSSGIYTYIRLPEEKGVFSVREDLSSYLIPREEWLDKQVISFQPDEVKNLSLTGAGKTLKMVKNENDGKSIWIREGSETEETAIPDQLKELSRLTALNFLPEGGTESPLATLTITTGSGDQDLMIYEKREDGYRARSSYGKGDFLIPAEAGNLILSMLD